MDAAVLITTLNCGCKVNPIFRAKDKEIIFNNEPPSTRTLFNMADWYHLPDCVMLAVMYNLTIRLITYGKAFPDGLGISSANETTFAFPFFLHSAHVCTSLYDTSYPLHWANRNSCLYVRPHTSVSHRVSMVLKVDCPFIMRIGSRLFGCHHLFFVFGSRSAGLTAEGFVARSSFKIATPGIQLPSGFNV